MTLCCIELFVLAIVGVRAAFVKRRQALAAAAAATTSGDSNSTTTITELTQPNDDDDESSFMKETLLKHPQQKDCCVNNHSHHHSEQHPVMKELLPSTPRSKKDEEIVAVGMLCEKGKNWGGVENKLLIPAKVDVESMKNTTSLGT